MAASVVRNIADKLIACSRAILSTFLGSIIQDSIISSNCSKLALYQKLILELLNIFSMIFFESFQAFSTICFVG
jgi:hypothetical protein